MQSIVVSNEILLERLRESDAKPIFSAIDKNRAHLGRWLPFVANTKELRDSQFFIDEIIESRDETLNEVYTIWYKGDFAGIISFHHTDRVNEKTEIGYWLISVMTGKGIITMSCNKLIDLAFEKMGMNRIRICCAVGNTASENIPKRLGFHYEGIEREGERYGDNFLDLKVYSLLKKDPR